MTWINTKKKRIMLDMMLTNRDSRILSKLDPKQIVEQIKKSGAEVVTVWFKDENGYTYYPTKYGLMHPNLKRQNFSGEMVALLNSLNIKVIAYYCVGLDWHYAKTRPEEQIVFSDLKPGIFPIPCLNTHYREYVFSQLEEIVREYDIHGVWLDCIFYPPKDFFPDPDSEKTKKTGAISCFCKSCIKKSLSSLGLTISPKIEIGSDSWVKWVIHKQETLDKFLRDARILIKSIKNHVKLIHNLMSFEQHDWRGSLSWRTAVYDDCLSAEAYYAWSGHLQTSLLPKLFLAAEDGKPFEVITLSYSHLWDWTVKPISQLLAETMTTMAHGGAVVVNDHLSPFGTAEPQMYQRIKKVFDYIEKVNQYYNDLESLKYAAVIYSEKSRDFYAFGDPRKYQSSFDGACRALIDDKIPFDVYMAESITIEKLRNYKVIILSNVACLNDEIAKIIDVAVNGGLGIVATYETSLYDDIGKRRKDFVLQSLGVHYSGKFHYPHIFYQFFQNDRSYIPKNIPINIPINMNKPYLKTVCDGQSVGHVRYPLIWACNHHYRYYENPPGGYTPSPALWVNEKLGMGKAVYIPCDIGGTYAEFTIPEAKHLIINAIFLAGGEPPLRLKASLAVEAIYQWQKKKNRIVIHLINFPSAPLRTAKVGGMIESVQVIEEIPQVHNLTLHLGSDIRQHIRKVSSIQNGNLDWQQGNEKVLIPNLHIHDVIILDLIN